MLNISGLQEGVVLDHIQAGKSLDIYYHLVDGYGGTSTFFAATAKGGISTNKGNWRNHVLSPLS